MSEDDEPSPDEIDLEDLDLEENSNKSGGEYQPKQIKDYLSNNFLKNTPEERVRQQYVKRLVEEYGYPKENLRIEVPIYIGHGKSEVNDIDTGSPKRADIVIYRNQNDKELNRNHYIIIECKKKDEKSGENQVKSYGNVTRAPIIVWHNGLETRYWSLKTEPNDWEPRAYLPKYGAKYGEKSIKKSDLRPASNLQATFKRIHNDIYANFKTGNKGKVFYQVIYLLFAKIQDEKSNDQICEFVIYDNEFAHITSEGKSDSFRKRIFSLFEAVKHRAEYRTVFDGNEKIEIPLLQVATIVSELEYVTVLNTDVKGEAFQAFLSAYFRGDAGQFFTPDPVKYLTVKILDPKEDELVLDPACGSSGFLVFTINHYKELIKREKNWLDNNGQLLQDFQLSKDQRELLRQRLKNIANTTIKGADFDNDLTKVAKMYMVMVDDGHTGIYTADTLSEISELEKVTNGELKNECADIIMTNPPFGSKGKVKKLEQLNSFDLGHQWNKDPKTGQFSKGEVLKPTKKGGGQVPDILFIERCFNLLRPGGRAGIVLPDGDLNNFSTEFVRNWILERAQIIAVISLPSTAFDPYGAKGIKTSVLFFKRPLNDLSDDYPIFFSNLKNIGYDVSGKVIYKTNEKGEVLDIQGRVIPLRSNGKGKNKKQDEEIIRQTGAIDDDIPDMLSKWEKFRQEFKTYLW